LNLPRFEQSNATYPVYRELSQSFTDVGLAYELAVNLISGGEPIRVPSAGATSFLFNVLGVPPELGRPFSEADDEFKGPQVAIISHGLWRGRFGGNPDNPLMEDVAGDVGQVAWILFGTMSFFLLIACANVANLFLVRSEGRSREIALRHERDPP